MAAALLLTSDTGPMLTPAWSVHPALGYAVAWAGTVPALRIVIRLFTDRRSGP